MSKPLSQKSIREIVQEAGTVSKKQLVDGLGKADISFNSALLDGYLEQALEKWLTQDEKGKYSIRKRAGGGGVGAPTKLYKLDDPMNPEGAKLVEQDYDQKVEESDDMVRRTPLAAIKAAKAHWYNTEYWPKLEAYRELEKANAPTPKEPKEEKAA